MEKELLIIKFSGTSTNIQRYEILKEKETNVTISYFGKDKQINKNKIDILDSTTGNFQRIINKNDYEKEVLKCLKIFIGEADFRIKLIQENKERTTKKIKELLNEK